jgi:hypothetical protein
MWLRRSAHSSPLFSWSVCASRRCPHRSRSNGDAAPYLRSFRVARTVLRHFADPLNSLSDWAKRRATHFAEVLPVADLVGGLVTAPQARMTDMGAEVAGLTSVIDAAIAQIADANVAAELQPVVLERPAAALRDEETPSATVLPTRRCSNA